MVAHSHGTARKKLTPRQRVLLAALAWHKHIRSIENISTDAPYQSKQVRELFAACDDLFGTRRKAK